MTRPRCRYKIAFCPKFLKFAPRGAGADSCCVIQVTPEEAEALRLKDIKGLEQTEAAKKMGVSQSTFQRVLASARKKVSEALIEGKIIEIVGQSNK